MKTWGPGQFQDGLTTLLGDSGGRFLIAVVVGFDAERLNKFLADFGLDEIAARNLRAFVARWSPRLERFRHGDVLSLWDMQAELKGNSTVEYVLTVENVDGKNIKSRLFHHGAVNLIILILRTMERAGDLPKGVEPDLIQQLAAGLNEKGK